MSAPHKGNAARPASPLIGRRKDAAAITAKLADGARLVTITGPGGIGKTRLLRELIADHAAELSAHGSGGAWWIEATHTRSVAELCALVAETLKVRGVGGRDPVGTLGRALRRMQRVLVGLDNLEQLGDDAAVALRGWLQAAPAAQFVATTRVAVDIEGQEVWPLAPLVVPARGATSTEIEASDAWQLFVARLRAIMPALEMSPELVADVAEIVRRVDGVPLAIELAAARAKVLTPAQIRERLADPLGLLVRAHDDGRHGSMRRTIADSVAMLPAWAQPCVEALGTFAGTIELEAMTSVLSSTGVDAAAALEALCDHGLIVRTLDNGRWTGRFAVFEPVRQFAGELADQHGSSSVLAIAHARWYGEWARELIPTWATDPDAARVAVARHLDNVLAAIRVAVGAAALLDEAAQLVLAVDPHLAVQGQHRRRLDLLGIVLAGPLAPAIEAELRLARGSAHRELGELDAANADWRSIEADTGVAVARITALAIGRRAELVEIDGRTDEATSMLRRALELLGSTTTTTPADRLAEAELHARRAHALRREAQLAEASTATARALALFTQAKHREGVVAMLYESAAIAMFRREDHAAERGFTEAIDLATELGARMQAAAARSALGILVQARGQIDRAISLLAESAREFRDLGHLHREGSALYSLASAYLERGDVQQALIVHTQAVVCIDAVGAARYQALLASLAALAHARLGAWPAADAALATAEAAEARCRREGSLHAVLAITRVRLSHRDTGQPHDRCLRDACALADATPGDDPQLFARLVAADRPAPVGRAPMRALRIDRTGAIQLGDAMLDLTRRLPLRRIVVALAERRIAAPGEAVSLAALVEAGWPGEKIRSDAAVNRVHVALSTLRRLGLRDVIVSGEHGYMVDPTLPVDIQGHSSV